MMSSEMQAAAAEVEAGGVGDSVEGVSAGTATAVAGVETTMLKENVEAQAAEVKLKNVAEAYAKLMKIAESGDGAVVDLGASVGAGIVGGATMTAMRMASPVAAPLAGALASSVASMIPNVYAYMNQQNILDQAGAGAGDKMKAAAYQTLDNFLGIFGVFFKENKRVAALLVDDVQVAVNDAAAHGMNPEEVTSLFEGGLPKGVVIPGVDSAE